MQKKDEISIERTIELEFWLLENSFMNMSEDELLKLLKVQNFTEKEIEYLLNAYHLPMLELRKEIETYDNTHPHMDEIKFLSSLEIKYNCDCNTIIKRIRCIRTINKYLKNNPSIIFPDVQIYNKLVRDKIPAIIEANDEKVVYRILDDEEYWLYLLEKDHEELEEVRMAKTKEEVKEELSDKLEVLRAMANYCGFTLEDIILASDLKREKKGGFSRKIFLEKTFK